MPPTTIKEYKTALLRLNVQLPSGQTKLEAYQQLYDDALKTQKRATMEADISSSSPNKRPSASPARTRPTKNIPLSMQSPRSSRSRPSTPAKNVPLAQQKIATAQPVVDLTLDDSATPSDEFWAEDTGVSTSTTSHLAATRRAQSGRRSGLSCFAWCILVSCTVAAVAAYFAGTLTSLFPITVLIDDGLHVSGLGFGNGRAVRFFDGEPHPETAAIAAEELLHAAATQPDGLEEAEEAAAGGNDLWAVGTQEDGDAVEDEDASPASTTLNEGPSESLQSSMTPTVTNATLDASPPSTETAELGDSSNAASADVTGSADDADPLSIASAVLGVIRALSSCALGLIEAMLSSETLRWAARALFNAACLFTRSLLTWSLRAAEILVTWSVNALVDVVPRLIILAPDAARAATDAILAADSTTIVWSLGAIAAFHLAARIWGWSARRRDARRAASAAQVDATSRWVISELQAHELRWRSVSGGVMPLPMSELKGRVPHSVLSDTSLWGQVAERVRSDEHVRVTPKGVPLSPHGMRSREEGWLFSGSR